MLRQNFCSLLALGGTEHSGGKACVEDASMGFRGLSTLLPPHSLKRREADMTCRFFYRRAALGTGTHIRPFSYEKLKHNMLELISCNCTSLCGKVSVRNSEVNMCKANHSLYLQRNTDI